MEFTHAETDRINQLYGSDFKDVTPDDMPLITRWERYKALQEDTHKAEIEAIKTRTDAELEEMKATYEVARSNLDALCAKALERYERS